MTFYIFTLFLFMFFAFSLENTSANSEEALGTKISSLSPLHYDKIQNKGIVH